jgi:hypothetical protein
MRDAFHVDLKELLRQNARVASNANGHKNQALEERAKPHDSGELDDGVLSLEELGEWPHPSLVRDR